MKYVNLIVVFLVFCNTLSIAQVDCYSRRVSDGDLAYKQGNYERALNYYQRARACVDRPSDLRDLDQKIRNCREQIRLSAKPKAPELSAKRLNFSSDGGLKGITIKTTEKWSYTDIPYWIKVEQSKEEIVIYCQQNRSTTRRTVNIKIITANHEELIEITQEGAGFYLDINPAYFSFQTNGGSSTVHVSTNSTSWYVDGLQSNNWFSVKKGDRYLYLTCAPNVGKPRNAVIKIHAGNQTKVIRIYQEGQVHRFRSAGLNLGRSFDALFQYHIAHNAMLEVNLGLWRYNEFRIGLSYAALMPINDEFTFYFGIGGGYGTVGYAPHFSQVLGVDYLLKQAGLLIGVDYRPFIGFRSIDRKLSVWHDITNFSLAIRYNLSSYNWSFNNVY